MPKVFEWLYRDPRVVEPTNAEMNGRELGSLVTLPLLERDSPVLTRVEIELELPALLSGHTDTDS